LKQIIDGKHKHNLSFYLKECWEYKEVLFALIYRQVKIKYGNTLLGLTWGIIQPILYIALLVVVFNKVAGIETGHSPIAFASVGLITWMYFSTCISNAPSAAIGAQDIIDKVYFPRIFIPIAVCIESLIDLAIIVIVSLLVGAWSWSIHVLLIIPIIIWLLIITLSSTLLVVMYTIRFPDVRFIIGVILRILVFITPIAYSSSMFDESFSVLKYINPLVGIIDASRYSIMAIGTDYNHLLGSLAITIFLVIFSLWSFLRFDRKIGDII
jgi:lipopolysaccharide transport system permease protein